MSAPTVEGATEAEAPVTVRLRGIGKRFPGVIANDDINIDVRRGTIHAIVGENGAGKSTLMKILYGVQPPDSGTIEIEGNQVSLHSPADAIKAGVGMVFQHFMLADNLTVLENVVLGAEKLHGIGGGRRVRRCSGSPTPTASGVEPDRLVEELGVGARQRVEILKVLYRGARIVILDEPTAVLVPQEVDELFGNLRELKKEGLSVIFINHKLDEVLAVADEITVIRRGTTVRTVLPTEVTSRQLAELMVGSELPSPSTETSTVTDKVLLSVEQPEPARGRLAARCSTTSASTSTRARCSASPASRATARPSSSSRSWACARASPARSTLAGHDHHATVDPRPPRGRRRLHPRGPAPPRAAARRAAVGEPGARSPEPTAQLREAGLIDKGVARKDTERIIKRVRRPHARPRRAGAGPVGRQPAEADRRAAR